MVPPRSRASLAQMQHKETILQTHRVNQILNQIMTRREQLARIYMDEDSYAPPPLLHHHRVGSSPIIVASTHRCCAIQSSQG